MGESTMSDPVINYLIDMGLGEREKQYRSLLRSAGMTDAAAPSARHFAIATASMMFMDDGLPMPAIMHIVADLKSRSDIELRDYVAAMLNKTYIVLSGTAETVPKVYNVEDLSEETVPTYIFKSDMYFVSALYKHAQQLLMGKA